ncbi:hypothetical protein P8452_48565 [Trifolium repens]|nr:hypothetical protein P8452_48565 [Trifolium repens]
MQQLLASDLEWWFHGPPCHRHYLVSLLTGSSSSSSSSQKSLVPNLIIGFGSIIVDEGYDEINMVWWVHAWSISNGIITEVREYVKLLTLRLLLLNLVFIQKMLLLDPLLVVTSGGTKFTENLVCYDWLADCVDHDYECCIVGGSGDGDFPAVVMSRVVFRCWFCYMGVSPAVVIANGFCGFADVIVSVLVMFRVEMRWWWLEVLQELIRVMILFVLLTITDVA